MQLLSLEQHGDIPKPRINHTAVIYKDTLIVFGGRLANRTTPLPPHVYAYNFTNCTWKQIESTSLTHPPPIIHHSAVVLNDKMYVFGGRRKSKKKEEYCNDLWCFDLKLRSWNLCKQSSGKAPQPRGQHTSVVYDESMYVFAGRNSESIFSNFFEYDSQKDQWSLIKTFGRKPSARFAHCAVVHNTKMIIFGGDREDYQDNDHIFMYDFESGTWTSIIDQPHADSYGYDFSHGAVILHDRLICYCDCCSRWNILDFREKNGFQALPKITSKTHKFVVVERNNKMIIVGGTALQNDSSMDDSSSDEDDDESIFMLAEFSIPALYTVNRLSYMLENELFVDVSFLVAYSKFKNFKAHQCIVSQSSVLNEMCKHAKKKRKKGEYIPQVVLNDIKPETFEQILRYLYGQELEIQDEDQFIALIEAASTFNLPGLREQCINKFYTIASEVNVIFLYGKAYELNIDPLKRLCIPLLKDATQTDDFYQQLETIPESAVLEILRRQLASWDFEKGDHYEPEESTLHQVRVHEHIVNLYKNNEMCNFTITAGTDKKQVKVNKALLCALCEYFEYNLDANSNEMEIEGMSGEVLEIILDFIFTNTLRLPQNLVTVGDIIRFSDLFGLKELKSTATSKLAQMITTNNVLEIIPKSRDLPETKNNPDEFIEDVEETPNPKKPKLHNEFVV